MITSNKTNKNHEHGMHSWPATLFICLYAVLFVSILDAFLSILQAPNNRISLTTLSASIVLSTALLTIVFLALWLVVGYFANRLLKLNRGPLFISLIVFVISCYIFYSAHSQLQLGRFPTDLRIPLIWLGACTVPLAFTVAAYIFGNAVHNKYALKNTPAKFLLAVPILLTEITLPACLYQNNIIKTIYPMLIAVLLFLIITFVLLVITFKVRTTRKIAVTFTFIVLPFCLLASFPMVMPNSLSKPTPQQSHQTKHIILISIDSLRQDALTCYNPQSKLTHNIEKLAAESTVFQNAFATAPWTMPSMASVMTGLPAMVYASESVPDYPIKLPNNVPTLAEKISNAGYLTCGIGRNTYLTPEFNFSRGFDQYYFYPRKNFLLGEKILASTLSDPGFKENISTKQITNLAVDWLSTHQDSDFFLWLHYFDPHIPYAPPKEYLPIQPYNRIGTRFDRLTPVRQGSFVPTLLEKQWIKQLYNAEVRYVDDNIGRLIAHLKTLGIYDDSIIILTSDHGEEFWEHDGFEHGHTVYNELLKVPLLVKLPGASDGITISENVSLQNITPTILKLCQIPFQKDTFPTAHALPLSIQNSSPQSESSVISSGTIYFENKIAVIFAQPAHKYIRSELTGKIELFNLQQDPLEKNNIAKTSPEKLRQAEEILAEHKKQTEEIKTQYSITGKKNKLNKDTIKTLKSLGYL